MVGLFTASTTASQCSLDRIPAPDLEKKSIGIWESYLLNACYKYIPLLSDNINTGLTLGTLFANCSSSLSIL